MAHRLKSLAPHDEDVANSHFPEKAEVLRQMPGDFAAATDDAVFAHGGNGFEMAS